MSPIIRTLMFGNGTECRSAAELLNASVGAMGQSCEYFRVEDFEDLEKALVNFEPTLFVALANGAMGMECVYRARERLPDLPVFWFSDDKDFAVLSYRLNCAYFSTKPVTAEKLANAFKRCGKIGIRYTVV